MQAKCWKCGAAFKFNEARVQKRALVRCPVCKSKNLLTQDPNSPEPRFYVSPYGQVDHKAPRLELETPRLELETPRLELEAPETTPDKSGDDEVDLPGTYAVHGDRKSVKAEESGQVASNNSLKPPLGSKPPISVKPLAAPPPMRRDSGIEPARKDSPAASNPPPTLPRLQAPPMSPARPARQQNQTVVMGPPPRSKGKGITVVVIISILLLLAAAGYFVLPSFFEDGSEGEEKKTEEKIHPGLKYVNEMKRQVGRPDESSLQLIKQAEIAFQKDESAGYDKALQLFKKALVLDSDNAELIARFVESTVLIQDKAGDILKVRKQIDLLDYGLTLAPEMASLYRAKARIYNMVDQQSRAEENAERARRLEPDNNENLVVLAETILGTNPRKASEMLTRVLEGAEVPLAAFRLQARAHMELGEFFQAEEMLKKREEMNPESCALCGELGRLYESLGLFDRAESTYSRLSQTNPTDPAGRLGLAHSKWLAGKPIKESRGLLSEITDEQLRQYALSERVKLLAARSHYALLHGDIHSAREFSEEAYRLDPSGIENRYQSALAQVLQGGLIKSQRTQIRSMLETLSLDMPKQPEIHTLWGLFSKKTGDLKRALAHFQKAIQIDSSYTHAHLQLAQLYLEALNFNRAFIIIEQLSRFSPDYWNDHPDTNMLTDVFQYEDKLTALIREVDESQVDKDKKYLVLGMTYYFFGKYRDAINALKVVLKNTPYHTSANLYQAFCYERVCNFSAARKHVATILGIDRGHATANYLFCRLLHKQGKTDDAFKRLKRLASTHGYYAPIVALFSIFTAQKGSVEDARLMARNAYRIDKHSLSVRIARYKAKS